MNIDNTITLDIEVLKIYAEANGSDSCIIRVYTKEAIGGKPVSNIPVVFRVDGLALFKESNSPIYKVESNDNGEIIVNIVNTIEEKNKITIFLQDGSSIEENVSVNFYNEIPELKIKAVENINHTFSSGEPSIAWPGAKFQIIMEGVIGEIEWSLSHPVLDISYEMEKPNILVININGYLDEAVTFIGTDVVTHQCVSYTLDIQDFAFLSQQPFDYENILESAPEHTILSKQYYDRLFREWGSMSSYPQFTQNEEFWSDEHSSLLKTVYIYNMDDGNYRRVRMEDHTLRYFFFSGRAPY